MTVYILLFLLLLMLVWIDKGRNSGGLFLWTVLGVFLVLALRNQNVGTDTETYLACWRHSQFYYGGAPTDIGFEALLRFLHLFNSSNPYFFVCIAVIMMIGVVYFVQKNSKYRVDSMLFFCMCGTVFIFFLLYLNAMRQCVAMTFFLIGISLYFEENRTKKKLYVAVASLLAAVSIHGSSAIAVPFIFALPYIRLNKKFAAILLLVTYVVGSLGLFQLSSLLSMLKLAGSEFNKYNGYTQEMTFGMTESTGIINMLLLPFDLVMLYIVYFINKEQLNAWSFKWLFVGTVLSNLMIDNLMWGRLLVYFTVVSIVVFPNYLRTVNFKYKNWVYLLVIAFFMRKAIVVLVNAPIYAFMKGLNTEVPYETWLFIGGVISAILLLHRVKQINVEHLKSCSLWCSC